jgi:hypothetical protein
MKTNSPYQDNPNLHWVERIARLMDSKYKIPGTRYRFGLDPILGLIPIVGDAASALISGGLIMYMVRYGVSRKIVYLMLLNTALDATLGSIPVIGWVFDFFYKANNRNIRLLKEHYHEGKHQGSGTEVLITVAIVMVVLIALIIWGLVALLQWLWSYI